MITFIYEFVSTVLIEIFYKKGIINNVNRWCVMEQTIAKSKETMHFFDFWKIDHITEKNFFTEYILYNRYIFWNFKLG